MTQISRFIGEVMPVAKRVTSDGDESAAPEGGCGFVDYAFVSLHCLRIYLDTSYRMTIDLLKENFEAECDLTDPNQNYDPRYGDRDVSVEYEAQDSFTYWSTRSGGGTRIEETPIMAMYPSAWVV